MALNIKIPKITANLGLRKKFFLSVVLPPLIPFVALSFLGYSQLSKLVEVSLVDQLARSASTTAAKLEREFSIRRTILQKTGKDVFAIKQEFGSQKDTLATQREGCLTAVNSNGFDGVIDSTDCEPFLAEFARLGGGTSPSALRNAVNNGYDKQISDLNTEEEAKIADRLDTFILYFPETLTIAIKSADTTTVQRGSDSSGLLSGGSVAQARDGGFVSNLQSRIQTRYITFGYPIEGQDQAILAAFDVDHSAFLDPAVASAPKLNQADTIIIGDSTGNAVYPQVDDNSERRSVLATVATQTEGDPNKDVYTYDDNGANLVSRGAPVGNINWAVLSASPESILLGSIRDAQLLAIGAILVSLVISLIVGLLFVNTATRAIGVLQAGAIRFGAHDLNTRINIQTGDELETLAATMNNMAARIADTEKALDEKNKEFINIATHELKAPMTAIIGNLSMLIDDGIGKVDQKARQLVEEARHDTENLRSLVEDLLDIARLEAGKAGFNFEPVDLTSVTSDVVRQQHIPAQEKNVSISYQPADHLPKVWADSGKVQIILNNFVSNAIKYNREGGSVTIHHDIQNNQLTTSVSDTGLGIPTAAQSQMFTKFFRAHSPSELNVSSTGLGMYITKQYVEAMGGGVWFESEEGHGSTFYFNLPVFKQSNTQAPVS